MPTVAFAGSQYELAPRETVLECLLRAGHKIPNSCRAGVCQSCLMQAANRDRASLPAESQASLKPTLTEQGYFLACVCRPEEPLSVELPGEGLRQPVQIREISRLSADVARVRLEPPEGFEYRAGQYVTLIRPDGLARTYSTASLPESGSIDLHVRRIPRGRFSGWLHQEARAGDALEMQGPAGSCFYSGVPPDQPLLLAGTGTGLAPLYGILQDALARGHTGEIRLYHGALHPAGLYLRQELAALAARHQQVRYVATALDGDPDADGVEVGALPDVILQRHPKLGGWRSFLCGDPGIVNQLRMKVFMAGVSMKEIFADAFLPAPSPDGNPV